MASNAGISLVISAVDRASSVIKNVNSSLAGMRKSYDALNDIVKETTGLDIKQIAGITGVSMALKAGIKLIKDSVNEWVDYNKTVREMTQVTGLGAEEISRIIQVADDWGISIDEVRTSLAFMNKQGITPSIDTLAKLADEYVAATDKAEWAEKAVKTLGRGYQTLIPILAKGGNALRDQAAGIADNMIATEESMAATREYEVALDNLGDTFTGLKNELAIEVIPTMIKFLDVTKLVLDTISTSKGSDWAPDILPQIQQIKQGIDEWELFVKWMNRGKIATADLQEQEDKLNMARQHSKYAINAETNALEDGTEAVEDATTMVDGYYTAVLSEWKIEARFRA